MPAMLSMAFGSVLSRLCLYFCTWSTLVLALRTDSAELASKMGDVYAERATVETPDPPEPLVPPKPPPRLPPITPSSTSVEAEQVSPPHAKDTDSEGHDEDKESNEADEDEEVAALKAQFQKQIKEANEHIRRLAKASEVRSASPQSTNPDEEQKQPAPGNQPPPPPGQENQPSPGQENQLPPPPPPDQENQDHEAAVDNGDREPAAQGKDEEVLPPAAVPTTPEVSMLTWNILARPYTKYNQKFHGNIEDPKSQLNVEAVSQTKGRYELAGQQIVALAHDLVFLQECEAQFFEPEWNAAANDVLNMYSVFPCRSADTEPGTAVLVKKEGRAEALVQIPVCVGGIPETKGPSKISTIVPVQVGSKVINAISTHFTGGGPNADKRLYHVNILGDRLKDRSKDELWKNAIILGGDFNSYGQQLKDLEKETFLGELQEVQLKIQRTGLSGDFKKQVGIDHVYISPDLAVVNAPCNCEVWPRLCGQTCGAAVNQMPSSPWGKQAKARDDDFGRAHDVKVSGASDHAPVAVVVKPSDDPLQLSWKLS